MWRHSRLLAGLDILDLEVAAIGNNVDPRDVEDRAGGLRGLRQLCADSRRR
jgi:hypothetical protein